MSLPSNVHNAVIEGLQKLVALRLRGAPPESAIVGTAQVWLEAIEAYGKWSESDEERVRKAFAHLFLEAREWVQPRDFLDRLPDRAIAMPLPKPKPSKEELARQAAMFHSLRGLFGRLGDQNDKTSA